jgi:hypothetical protein
MAYYYVKSGGTAATATDDGRYASQQTGTFAGLGAANYYNQLTDAYAAATPPADDDIVLVSDSHAYTGTTYMTIGIALTRTSIICVSDTDIEVASTGASEACTDSSNDVALWGYLFAHGIDFATGDDTKSASSGNDLVFSFCSFTASASGDTVFSNGVDGGMATFYDCTFNYNHVGALLGISGGSTCIFHHCLFTGTGATATIISGSAAGGTHVYMYGCDLSPVAHVAVSAGGMSSPAGDDHLDLRLYNCKLNAATVLSSELSAKRNLAIYTYNTADTSAAAEYQYHYESAEISVDDETSIYRNGSTAFPSGTKTSLKCVTLAACIGPRFVGFDFPTRYAELSNTASDTLRIYITSSVVLTDAEVWADVMYPDSADSRTPNNAQSVAAAFNPLRTGTTLSTNTESWTGGLTYKYHIDIDTSGNAGADCWPTIRVYVAKPSATIYFCPSVDVR